MLRTPYAVKICRVSSSGSALPGPERSHAWRRPRNQCHLGRSTLKAVELTLGIDVFKRPTNIAQPRR
jgi:hypothetical protein